MRNAPPKSETDKIFRLLSLLQDLVTFVDVGCRQLLFSGTSSDRKMYFSPLGSLQSPAQLASNVCTVIHVDRLNSPPPASPAPPAPPPSPALVLTHPATFIANNNNNKKNFNLVSTFYCPVYE